MFLLALEGTVMIGKAQIPSQLTVQLVSTSNFSLGYFLLSHTFHCLLELLCVLNYIAFQSPLTGGIQFHPYIILMS